MKFLATFENDALLYPTYLSKNYFAPALPPLEKCLLPLTGNKSSDKMRYAFHGRPFLHPSPPILRFNLLQQQVLVKPLE